ncbi:AAA family ATPase [Paenibacillus sp. FSL R7-0302]|uniref:AAA family ATPase n=1 Tax=Paenibacillus sp. FSL R7-0302 TaxID=2921681 RepID=UPI0030FB4AFA
MPQLHVLVGLPASGKSTFAKKLKATVISSDKLREELLGDVNDQNSNELIFNTMYERAEKQLAIGLDVYLDATHISAKVRKRIIERFRKKADKLVAHYFNTPFYPDVVHRNRGRERSVPYSVLTRMRNSLQVPMYSEGWNEIVFHNLDEVNKQVSPAWSESILTSEQSYDSFMGSFTYWDAIESIIDLPQDNPHHSLSVSRHTYYVWDYIRRNYNNEDILVMLWAALFHDTGKKVTKSFKTLEDGTTARYANFIGHENVSAQLAANVLANFYDTNFVLKVVEIVQNHMRLLSAGDSSKARNKLFTEVGKDVFEKLEFFRSADTTAK